MWSPLRLSSISKGHCQFLNSRHTENVCRSLANLEFGFRHLASASAALPQQYPPTSHRFSTAACATCQPAARRLHSSKKRNFLIRNHHRKPPSPAAADQLAARRPALTRHSHTASISSQPYHQQTARRDAHSLRPHVTDRLIFFTAKTSLSVFSSLPTLPDIQRRISRNLQLHCLLSAYDVALATRRSTRKSPLLDVAFTSHALQKYNKPPFPDLDSSFSLVGFPSPPK